MYIEESQQNLAVCCCKTIDIPPTLQLPAAEVISQEAIDSQWKDMEMSALYKLWINKAMLDPKLDVQNKICSKCPSCFVVLFQRYVVEGAL